MRIVGLSLGVASQTMIAVLLCGVLLISEMSFDACTLRQCSETLGYAAFAVMTGTAAVTTVSGIVGVALRRRRRRSAWWIPCVGVVAVTVSAVIALSMIHDATAGL